jgi:hypothetical protein
MLCVSVVNAATPDRKNMTIKGCVTASGNPLKGVVVSDGVEVTTTDANGNYWLKSAKENGWVYVSIPGGYEAPSERCLPQFYAYTNQPANVVEEHNFELKPVDQSKYKLLVVTDMHLANRRNDLEQVSSTFIPTIKNVVDTTNVPVYTLNLGDMSFDMYWYANKYAIEDYKQSIQVLDYPTPMFHVPGNHDNDGAVTSSSADSTDFLSVQRYVKTLGPNYYSFNIGNAHYVMLDNIVYRNEPGGKKFPGIKGARNYDKRITPQELAWLKKDLATVKDKNAPVFVGMHAAAYHYKSNTDSVVHWFSTLEDSEALSDCFNGFTNVHYVTGHTHYNNTTYVRPNLIEHNIGAVCGVWWYPGTVFLENICPNGAPVGYKVFNIDGSKVVDWQYHGTVAGNKQFRAYDMNTVREFYRTDADMQRFIEHYPARDLSNVGDNEIYINVFDWSPDWTVTVTENGKQLSVTHEMLEEPFYTISYDFPRATRSGNYPDSDKSKKMNHMFRAVAATADLPVTITVTDHFGRTFTEIMQRPKTFSPEMK